MTWWMVVLICIGVLIAFGIISQIIGIIAFTITNRYIQKQIKEMRIEMNNDDIWHNEWGTKRQKK